MNILAPKTVFVIKNVTLILGMSFGTKDQGK
jgi:hypothetical protein